MVLVIVNRDLSSSTSFNTSFDMCSVQLVFFILRHTFMSSFLIVLISAQYKVTLQISVFTILFLRHLHSSQSSPWQFFPPGKGFFSITIQGRQSWGLRVATPRFWADGSHGGSQGGRWGRGRVVKYYYILLCTGSMFESGYF